MKYLRVIIAVFLGVILQQYDALPMEIEKVADSLGVLKGQLVTLSGALNDLGKKTEPAPTIKPKMAIDEWSAKEAKITHFQQPVFILHLQKYFRSIISPELSKGTKKSDDDWDVDEPVDEYKDYKIPYNSVVIAGALDALNATELKALQGKMAEILAKLSDIPDFGPPHPKPTLKQIAAARVAMRGKIESYIEQLLVWLAKKASGATPVPGPTPGPKIPVKKPIEEPIDIASIIASLPGDIDKLIEGDGKALERAKSIPEDAFKKKLQSLLAVDTKYRVVLLKLYQQLRSLPTTYDYDMVIEQVGSVIKGLTGPSMELPNLLGDSVAKIITILKKIKGIPLEPAVYKNMLAQASFNILNDITSEDFSTMNKSDSLVIFDAVPAKEIDLNKVLINLQAVVNGKKVLPDGHPLRALIQKLIALRDTKTK